MRAILGMWIGVLVLAGMAGCSTSVADPDSETHWLRACDVDSDCQSGLSCLCNTCTRPCESNSCGDLGGSVACVTPDASALAAACEIPPSAAVCTKTCSNDTDCSSLGSTRYCIGGACLAGSPLKASSGGAHVSTSDRCDATPRTLVAPSDVFSPPGAGMNVPGPGQPGGHSFIDIAVNATYVYYAFDSAQNAGIDGAVMRVALTGGTPTRVAPVEGRLQSLVLTAASVIFAQDHTGDDGGFSQEIIRAPFDGRAATVLARTTGSAELGAIATDGRNVYFADEEGTKSVSLSGGIVQLLAPVTGSLALVGTNLIITTTPLAPATTGSVLSVPVSGGTPVTLASNQSEPRLPLGCGADICWMTGVPASFNPIFGTGAIVRQSAGGTPQTVIEDGNTGASIWFVQQLVFDGASFFASEFNDLLPHEGTPFRLPAAGGTPVSLLENGGSVAVDDRCLYMASSVAGITSVVKSYTPPGN